MRLGKSPITRDVGRVVPHIAAQRNPGDIISKYLLLDGLRVFYPMSSRNASEGPQDISGQGRHLTNVSATAFGVQGPIPYAIGDGSADYLNRTDEAGLSITGDITFGGWFYSDVSPGSTESLINKWNPTGSQRSYGLNLLSTPAWEFVADQTGAGSTINTITSTDYTATKWHHVVARLEVSTEISLWVQGVETSSTSSIITGIFDSTADLTIMSRHGGAQFFDGRAALCFICAGLLTDATIKMLYEMDRPFFGV